MKITFLTHSVDFVGGTIRATLNTASALTDLGHQVEIVNIFKYRKTPQFTPDPRVAMSSLVDKTVARSLVSTFTGFPDIVRKRKSSAVYPDGDTRAGEFSRLTDKRVKEFLRSCESDVIIGTRPGLNVYIANYSPQRAVTVAQEHLFYNHHKEPLRDAMSQGFDRLDAVVTVSEADADNYRHQMPHLASRVWFIPNSIQPTELPASDVDSKIIIAAGRIERSKRFDMLLRVFAKVHQRHPDWRLRIYGGGKHLDKVREVLNDLDLGDAVSLMGMTTPLDSEWIKGSIAAMTSKYESFGLTLVEAMNCGLPVVSTACNYGPPEIIDHEIDGLLTPLQDENALVEALCRLIEDDNLRKRMSANAIRKARSYYPSSIGARYDELFRRLVSLKDPTPPRGSRIPVGVATGGSGLAASPEPADSADTRVNCQVKSFEDLTLTNNGGFHGHYTLESLGRQALAVPHNGSEMRLDAAFLRRVPEDRWRLFCDGEPVEPGNIDARALLNHPQDLPGSVVIPYTSRGQFALRVWRRESYAELTAVRWHNGCLHLEGEALGTMWGTANINIVARLRDNENTLHQWSARLRHDGTFTACLSVGDLVSTRVETKDLWDLWLADGAGEHAPVRLARLFDDIAKRKKTQTFAHKSVRADGLHRIQPYYNTHNELSIRIKDEADVESQDLQVSTEQ